MQKFFAHSVEGKPKSEWQPLDEHLQNVAELAKKTGDKFGGGLLTDFAFTKQRRSYEYEQQRTIRYVYKEIPDFQDAAAG